MDPMLLISDVVRDSILREYLKKADVVRISLVPSPVSDFVDGIL